MCKINIGVLIVLVFLSCKQTTKDLNCNDFRAGVFHYSLKATGNSYLITRTDSIQIERNLTTGAIVRAHIKWINECEYQLNYIDELITNKDSIDEYLKTHTLTTRILKAKTGEINGTLYNYCIFESSMPGVNQKLVDTLWKHNSTD